MRRWRRRRQAIRERRVLIDTFALMAQDVQDVRSRDWIRHAARSVPELHERLS